MSKKATDKLERQAIREQQKRLKPGECQKYVRMVLDRGFMQTHIGQEMLSELNAADLTSSKQAVSPAPEIRDLAIRNCILWERNAVQRTLCSAGSAMNPEWQMEKQVVQILDQADYKRALEENALPQITKRLGDAYPEMSHTLIVPRIKIKNDDFVLTELEILQGVKVVKVRMQNSDELLTLLRRYTKAIAEAPFKEQRSETLNCFKKYLANDKKQCVRVEGANGLGRLWQQHLNRLPLVTLEVAETIIAEHSCPKKLIEQFDTNPHAIATLADTKIKRSGPLALQSDRRIGKVLSQKLYNLYTTRDPDSLI